MHFLPVLGLMLAFALGTPGSIPVLDGEGALGRPGQARPARHSHEVRDLAESRVWRGLSKRAPKIKNFQITELYSNDFSSTDTVWNRSAHFVVTDFNSNTSTICSQSWTQSNTTNNFPVDYILCDFTANDEFFIWKFTSYTSLGNFTLQLAHEFSDPVNYPPPYNVVEYFSAPTTFNLDCVARQTSSGSRTYCVTNGPVTARVTGVAN